MENSEYVSLSWLLRCFLNGPTCFVWIFFHLIRTWDQHSEYSRDPDLVFVSRLKLACTVNVLITAAKKTASFKNAVKSLSVFGQFKPRR